MTPVTLITGTSRGIGRSLAEHYLGRGHRVVGCSRGSSDLDHGCYRHVEVDVTEEAAVRSLLSSIRKTEGRLDHAVCNAGAASMNAALLTPLETLRRILAVNLEATFLTVRESARVMQRSGGGRIVTFTTVAVPLHLAGEAAYVSAKAGVEELTRVMARELGPAGITVNAVGPSPIPTALIRGVPQAKIDSLVEQQAIKRLGCFDDVANVVDFFLDPRSTFVTGQVVYLGGVA